MKTIIIFLFLTCCLVQVSFAQVIVNPATCLMDTFRVGNTKTPLNYTTVTGFTSTVMNINIGTVNYQIATDPTGRKHIAIDWLSLSGTNPNMSDLAIREFIINRILRLYGTGSYNVYYKEECKKEIACTYLLKSPINLHFCCENINDLSYFTSNMYSANYNENFHFYDIKRTVVCGFKCCYDTYTISNQPTPLSITRGQGQGFGISATPCQNNHDIHCIKTGNDQIIPCEDEGCYQWR